MAIGVGSVAASEVEWEAEVTRRGRSGACEGGEGRGVKRDTAELVDSCFPKLRVTVQQSQSLQANVLFAGCFCVPGPSGISEGCRGQDALLY